MRDLEGSYILICDRNHPRKGIKIDGSISSSWRYLCKNTWAIPVSILPPLVSIYYSLIDTIDISSGILYVLDQQTINRHIESISIPVQGKVSIMGAYDSEHRLIMFTIVDDDISIGMRASQCLIGKLILTIGNDI